MAFDKQARLNQIREQRKASNLAQRERIRHGVERLRAARLSRAKGMASGGDVMDDKMGRAMSKRGDMSDKMGRAMARGMKSGGKVKKMAGGGMSSSYRKAADGVAHKGKTKAKQIKMARGGKC